jgi:hypothetical protein
VRLEGPCALIQRGAPGIAGGGQTALLIRFTEPFFGTTGFEFLLVDLSIAVMEIEDKNGETESRKNRDR